MKTYWYVLTIELISIALFCFLLAWLNVRQIAISYEISRLNKEYIQKKELNSKLLVEKSVLFSPYRLREIAKQFGLRPIDPDRVRNIEQ